MGNRNRRAGVLNIQVNGQVYDAVGNFSHNIAPNIKKGMSGPNGVHGYNEIPQIPYIEGEIRDAQDLDLRSLFDLTDATITLTEANGKVFMLREAWYAGEGKVGTEEANVEFKFEGMGAEEIPA